MEGGERREGPRGKEELEKRRRGKEKEEYAVDLALASKSLQPHLQETCVTQAKSKPSYLLRTHSGISDHGIIHLIPIVILVYTLSSEPVAVQSVNQFPSAALKVQVHYQLRIQVAPGDDGVGRVQ